LNAKVTPAARAGLRGIFRSMSNRNYQLYFSGQLVSNIGTWMQQLALSWLTYRVTNSAFMLGLIAFISQSPTLFVAPFAGILADRLNRHKLVMATQTLAMIQAGLLAFLTLSGHIQLWQIIALGFFAGCINAVDMPSRQAFIVDICEKREDLSNAIALNSSLVNLTRLIGPAIAGLVISWVGEGMCFLFNALSYVAVLIALMCMKLPARERVQHASGQVIKHLKEGCSYAFGFEPIRMLLIITAITSIAGMPYMMLMPVYAQSVFHGSAGTLGLLMTASAIGSVAGTIMLAARESILGLGKWICGSMALFSVALILFGYSHSLPLALCVLPIIGFGMIVQNAACNTLLQTLVEEDKRGRVMSLYSICFLGFVPLGSLISGYLSSQIGVANTILIGALVCFATAIWSFGLLPSVRQKARPVYIARGVIQQ
jgi:MFS family permease